MPIETFTLVPNTGRDYVELTSWAGSAVFPVTPVSGDQIEYPTGLTVGADGVVTGADGTYTLRLIKADTGTVYAVTYQIISGSSSGQAQTSAQNSSGQRIITGASTQQAGSGGIIASGSRTVSGASNPAASNATQSAGGDRLIAGVSAHQSQAPTQAADGEVTEQGETATSTFTLVPPDNHAVVTLASGFDISLFQGEGNEWPEGEPAIGWQIVYPTANGTIINNLAELQTDATEPFDIWLVDLNGTWYGTYIDPAVSAGSHQASTATQVASGVRLITGGSSGESTTATHSALGSVGGVVSGTSSSQAASATQIASGLREITGGSTAQAHRATQSGSGLRVVGGIATTQAGAATHDAQGQVSEPEGSGAASHQAQPASHSAAGLRIVGGSGSSQASRATHSAAGLLLIIGSAAHQANRATQAGGQQPQNAGAVFKRPSVINVSPQYSVANLA